MPGGAIRISVRLTDLARIDLSPAATAGDDARPLETALRAKTCNCLRILRRTAAVWSPDRFSGRVAALCCHPAAVYTTDKAQVKRPGQRAGPNRKIDSSPSHALHGFPVSAWHNGRNAEQLPIHQIKLAE
jgi:hypothetical protein